MWPVPALQIVASAASKDYSTPNFFCKDGRKIGVGDCALFKPSQDTPPFIGIIRRLTLRKEDNIKLGVNWLYRPADLELAKGILLEAAPNEVFYSFHKDEIPAASLLHPCKVTFLCKGVEFPAGISSFVCRRVYDIENKCLWWLTDKDYVNERQEEVDQLLHNTRLGMYGAVQPGGRSPKSSNGLASVAASKPCLDVRNSSFSFLSQVKSKKREKSDQGADYVQRGCSKIYDGDSGLCRLESMLRSEIDKITEKGGLIDFEGVEKLVQLMQLDRAERKVDLGARILLIDVIALTYRFDCLGWFVQLKGLVVLDEWLQEAHKGKIGGSSSSKDCDKSVEEYLLALLHALDKLPVNLHALQTCNVGKSVNNLRNHRNSEINKKAKNLVDTWKKRVEAEMKFTNARSGCGRDISWSAKPPSEISSSGNKKSVSTGVGLRASLQPGEQKSPLAKLDAGDTVSKSSFASFGLGQLPNIGMATNTMGGSSKLIVTLGASDLHLIPVREEKNSSFCHSQDNSHCFSSDCARLPNSSLTEDARSSTAGSEIVDDSGSRIPRSKNGLVGLAMPGIPLKTAENVDSSNRSFSSGRASSTGVPRVDGAEIPMGNHEVGQRLIACLPQKGCSPARSADGGSLGCFTAPLSAASHNSESHGCSDLKVMGSTDVLWDNTKVDVKSESETKGGEDACVDGNISHGEECKAVHDCNELMKDAGLTSGDTPNSGGLNRVSASSMNALVESCAELSETCVLVPDGEVLGMDLLASVAAREMSKSDVSPGNIGGNSPMPEYSSGDDARSRQPVQDIVCDHCQCDDEGHSGKHKIGEDSVHSNSPNAEMQDALAPSLMLDVKNGEFSAERSEGFPSASAAEVDNLMGKRPSQFHEQRIVSAVKVGNYSIFNPARMNPSLEADKKLNFVSNEHAENKVACDELATNAKANMDVIDDDVSSTGPLVGVALGSSNYFGSECKPDEAGSDVKAVGVEQIDNQNFASSNLECNLKYAKEKCERKEDCGHYFDESASCVDSTTVWGKEVKPSVYMLDCMGPVEAETPHIVPMSASLPSPTAGSNISVKLDFDLNEGFPADDGNHSEFVGSSVPGGLSASLPVNSSLSESSPSSITVAAAAKGPFVPPENFLRSKRDLGWRGSAATSAFRPAEPRKVQELLQNTTGTCVDTTLSKQTCCQLDFDLNVAYEKTFDDLVSTNSTEVAYPGRSPGRIDLDLNRIDETTDTLPLAIKKGCSLEYQPGIGIPDGRLNVSRDFDLNDGPYFDEEAFGVASQCHYAKRSVPYLTHIPGAFLDSSPELGNFPSLFPPANSYSAFAIPPMFHGRVDQAYSTVIGAGSQRIMGSPAGGNTSFVPEMYRGHVFPAAVHPPAATATFPAAVPFQGLGFPFETGFPLLSNSFSGSTPYVEAPSGGGLCFPAIQSAFVGPPNLVSSQYPRPYVIGFPGVGNNISPENRKYGNHRLDLNAGPGCADVERRDEMFPSGSRQLPVSQALADDGQGMTYPLSGRLMKRKEPAGAWDTADRYGYNQSHRG